MNIMDRIASDRSLEVDTTNSMNMEGIENSSVFRFFYSIMPCRDGLCWSQTNDVTASSPTTVDTLQRNYMSTLSFHRTVSSYSPPSVSMSNNIVDKQDYYASRWQGHMPLSTMPSNDSFSPKKIPLTRRRSVR